MTFEEWLKYEMPNKPNNPHTVFSAADMKRAFEGGKRHCDCVFADNSRVIANLQEEIKNINLVVK